MSYLQIDSIFLGRFNNAENGNFHSKMLLTLEPEGLVAAINAVDTVVAYTAAEHTAQVEVLRLLPIIEQLEASNYQSRECGYHHNENGVQSADGTSCRPTTTNGIETMNYYRRY